MGDGTAAELARLKRIDAQQRQKIAVPAFPALRSRPTANPSSVADVAAALAVASIRRCRGPADIALTPSTTFAVSPGHAPNGVRLALAALRSTNSKPHCARCGNVEREGRGFDSTNSKRAIAVAAVKHRHSAIKLCLYGSILSIR